MAWVIVFATHPAIVETYTTEEMKTIHEVDAGMSKLSFPLHPGGGVKAVMIREGTVVANCTPIGYRFESRPGVYNFNAYVAMSP